MKTTPNPFLLTLTVSAALLAQAKPASNQPEDHQRRVSEWDHATAERLFREGAWREGVAYLGRALRLDQKNSAAAWHIMDTVWGVVYGEGDRNTVPTLLLPPQEAKVHVVALQPRMAGAFSRPAQIDSAPVGFRDRCSDRRAHAARG